MLTGVAVREPESPETPGVSLKRTVMLAVPAPATIWAPRGRVQLYSVAPVVPVRL